MRKLSTAEMKKLRAEGRLTIKEPPKKSAPVKEAKPSQPQPVDPGLSVAINRQSQATAEIAKTLGEGQMMLVKKLETALITNQKQGVKPIPYRFTIKRDRRGLMETIDAYPILEDSE